MSDETKHEPPLADPLEIARKALAAAQNAARLGQLTTCVVFLARASDTLDQLAASPRAAAA